MNGFACVCCANPMQFRDTYNEYARFKCEACGYERFKSDEAVQSSDYEDDSDYLDDIAVYPNVDDRILWHHKRALDFIQSDAGKDAEVLDVGCFDGFFVRKLRDHGIDAHGVDFNRKAIADGAARFALEGRLSNKSAADLLAEGRQFDVVTMFEVIEHLDDFSAVMSDCIALLKPGGHFIISAPNNDMSWRPPLDFPPHHLSRFSPGSLEKLAARYGLKPIKTMEQSSLFDLTRHYIGLKFREGDSASMRGGEFKNRGIVDPLRKFVTRSKWLVYGALKPVDAILHAIGFRYIGQLMIARNDSAQNQQI